MMKKKDYKMKSPHNRKFDPREEIGPSPNYMERRRGSVVESRTDANKELISYS